MLDLIQCNASFVNKIFIESVSDWIASSYQWIFLQKMNSRIHPFLINKKFMLLQTIQFMNDIKQDATNVLQGNFRLVHVKDWMFL